MANPSDNNKKKQIDTTLLSAAKEITKKDSTRTFVDILSNQMLESFHIYKMEKKCSGKMNPFIFRRIWIIGSKLFYVNHSIHIFP